MAAKDEDGGNLNADDTFADGNVNADGNLAESGEIDQLLQDISNVLLSRQGTSNNEQGTIANQLLPVSSTTSSNVPVTSGEATSSSVPVNSGEYEMMFSPLGVPLMSDDEDVTKLIDNTCWEYNETRDRLKTGFSLLPLENDDDSKELSKIDPSSSSDHHEAEHVQYGTHEPVIQPTPTRQSITTTASSSGRSPSVSMTKAFMTSTDFVPRRNQQAMNLPQPQRNQQAMNLPQTQRNPQAMNPHYSQLQVPSGQYSNITRPPYLPPSALPFQQPGGSNTAHYGTMVTYPYWRPEQTDIYNTPQPNAFVVPYGTMVTTTYWRPEQTDIYNMPQIDGSVVTYAYGSPNPFDTSAYSRFGYEGVPGNYLSSIPQHQSTGDSIVRPPSNTHSRQQRQHVPWSDDFATQNQQNDRSDDPSDQTQRDN